MITDELGLEILEESECRQLLESAWLGRIAVTIGAVPAIFPVNYLYTDGAIFFRTAEGVKFESAVDHTVVAFEVDFADEHRRAGWSVLIVGHSSVVEDPDVIARILERSPEPWAPGVRNKVVKVDPVFISGRRIADVLPGA